MTIRVLLTLASAHGPTLVRRTGEGILPKLGNLKKLHVVLVVAHITSPHFNQTLSNPDGIQAHVTELKELRRRVEVVVKSFLYDRNKGGLSYKGQFRWI